MKQIRGLVAMVGVVALAGVAGCSSDDGAEATANGPDVKTSSVAPPPGNFAPESASKHFWGKWQDGKAEMNGYDLIQPRYGELRKGRAVNVFVTEPYSRSRKVKVDNYDSKNADHVMALKLNAVKKFPTGVYDYSLLTSVFVDPASHFMPLEVTFSMQEWCGHVFEEVHFGGSEASVSLNSYFEGESGDHTISTDGGLMSEDSLIIALRGLAGDKLARKDAKGVRMLPSATDRRFRHVPPTAFETSITWSPEAKEVTVPAGTFEVWEVSYTRQAGTKCSYQIEAPYPHRVVGWRCDDGELAKLTGSTRLAYWGTHGEGDEKLLRDFGLEPVDMSASGGAAKPEVKNRDQPFE